MSLQGKSVIVTGGSRGLGLGAVEALVEAEARVTVVARNEDALAAVKRRLGVAIISADIAEAGTPHRVLADLTPDVIILNAGAIPPMGRLDQLSWEEFATTWDVDVKAGFHWIQAALRLPAAAHTRLLVGSSGAALDGSPLSGGYAGAKRMLWLLAKYANKLAAQKSLGVRCQVIVPQQMVEGTGVGDVAASAYAQAMGVDPHVFLARFGAPMPPRKFGDYLIEILEEPRYQKALALGLRGDTGITILEGADA